MKGLSSDTARLFLEQQLRRHSLHDRISDDAKKHILDACRGHPGFIVLACGACASTNPDDVAKDLRTRRGFFNALVSGLLRRLKLAQPTTKMLAALARTRSPVPLAVLESILPPVEISLAIDEANETSLVEQRAGGLVQINPLLAQTAAHADHLTESEARDFHRAAFDFFRTRPEAERADRLLDMVEAAYHAMRAGVAWKPPFGHRDASLGIAREAYEKEDYATVVRVLEGLGESGQLTSDGLRYLAESYAWLDRFAEYHVVIAKIPPGHVLTQVLFTAAKAALHAGKHGEVERILERADRTDPGHYKISLMRGRLAERLGRSQQAELLYQEACERTSRDRWPYFYLARLLLDDGLPEDALRAIDEAKENPEFMSRTVEYALLQVEMVALVMLGDWERARAILGVLDRVQDLRPEAVVAAAYVRALFDEGSLSRVASFENALRRLEGHAANRRHTKAQISMFRGQLYQSVGNLADARRCLEEALELDAANLYMKKAYLRILNQVLREPKQAGEEAPDAAYAALEVAKAVLEQAADDREAQDVQRLVYEKWGLQ